MTIPNQDQADFWSKKPGQVWSENDVAMDATLAPVLDHLLEAAALQSGERVLDIGCGTGLSTVRAGRLAGHVTGVDIADQMLVKARAAAEGQSNVDFLCADAQVHAFGDDVFDAVISRFGVMFFADPPAAFANIARAVKPGGRMVFMTWASGPQNPWFAVPRAVATDRLGEMEPTPPNAPGPMGLADENYTFDVFAKAGLSDVTITSVSMHLTPPGTAHWMGEFSLILGPASRIFSDLEGTEEDAAAIVEGVSERFKDCETEDGLRIPAVLNRIQVQC
ncbi:MAG: methyltransferase domain-containing protein [Pseudomonadota bacterium]